MTLGEDMVNGHGIGHGGLTFTLADSAFAFACNSYNRPPSPPRPRSGSGGPPSSATGSSPPPSSGGATAATACTT